MCIGWLKSVNYVGKSHKVYLNKGFVVRGDTNTWQQKYRSYKKEEKKKIC